MPELPEVETIVREMCEARLEGAEISGVEVYWNRSIATPALTEFVQKMRHQTIQKISRRGKFIVIKLSQDTVLVHLRMTGKFLISATKEPPHTHERVRLYLNDGRLLRYEDQRKFGKWYLLENPEDHLDQLGIEPLSSHFTLKTFQNLLKGSQRPIKPFLLDQHKLVGLGNIYVDEALWQAEVHPKRSVSSLTQKEMRALHQAIPEVLQKGIDNIGTSLGSKRANYYSVSGRRGTNQQQLKVFRRDGLPCPRCGNIIKKIVVAQRGTHFCPFCQKI